MIVTKKSVKYDINIGAVSYTHLMQNAAPEVRAEADYITLSNEEDGVAAALEHFCKKDF